MPTTVLNYYDLLGVSQIASDEEIRKAFRRKIIKVHPDHNKASDANQRTIELTEAYEVLKNPATRTAYDKILNEKPSTSEREKEHFKQAQQSARKKAQTQSNWSVEEILATVVEVVLETGSGLISGNAEHVSLFDYIRSGFLGLLLVIAFILSFTGIGTVPGVIIMWIIISGISKGDEIIGFGRFIGSTLVVVLIVVVVLGIMLISVL